MSSDDRVLFGKTPLTEGKRLKAALGARGIRIELVADPAACETRGCAPAVELYANPADLPSIQEFFKLEQSRDSGGLEFDPALLDEVFDPERDRARCPACGEVFATSLTECPGCGLGFGGPL